MEKKDKLKQLEKLFESQGMQTGLAAMQSDVFQKVAKGSENPSAPVSPPSKIKSVSSASSAPTGQSSASTPAAGGSGYSYSGNFKNELALKETREELNRIKTTLYSIKGMVDDYLTQNLNANEAEDVINIIPQLVGLIKEEGMFNEWLQAISANRDYFIQQLESVQNSLQQSRELYKLANELQDNLRGVVRDEEEKQFGAAILVVDDSLTHRKILQSNLESLNFRNVIEAKDAKEALKILEKYATNSQLPRISLISIDKDLSGINGLDFAKIIRHQSFITKYPQYKDIPLLMTASQLDKVTIIEAHQAGINEFIKKPIDRKVLEDKISKFL